EQRPVTAEPIRRHRSASAGVFPFLFGWQTITWFRLPTRDQRPVLLLIPDILDSVLLVALLVKLQVLGRERGVALVFLILTVLLFGEPATEVHGIDPADFPNRMVGCRAELRSFKDEPWILLLHILEISFDLTASHFPIADRKRVVDGRLPLLKIE